jgi:putative two-component system response regulator
MRVLVVDDDPVSVEMLRHFLQTLGYEVGTAYDGQAAYEQLCSGEFRIVISDWDMPGMTGIDLCRRIRKRRLSGYVYIILLTSFSGTQNVVQGLAAGADDFLTKPYQPDELRVRLRVAERVLSLESRDLIIFAMAKLAESRDPETGAHLERMREYCRVLAEELCNVPKFAGVVDEEFVDALYLTSPLHDIGKVGIPDSVLLKPGRLTSDEFEVMKRHAAIGAETLDAAVNAHASASFLRLARDIAWTHHERLNGSGYPRHLKGEEIPLCGRIAAVADVYDALTSKRVYKSAFSHEKARTIVVEGRGTDFDPDIVDAFLAHETTFIDIQRRFNCGEEPALFPSLSTQGFAAGEAPQPAD